MRNWATNVAAKYMNTGTPLVLMGAMWLYLWVFQWYPAYVYDPRWGHNYAEAAAFLIVGLAYFNRRLISDIIALVASALIVPVSLELLPHSVTAIIGGVLIAFTVADMIVERGRETDLGQSSNRRWNFWLKRHVLRFAYFMLGHMALIYYLVRLPAGTYEDDLVTKVYDGMLIPLITLALLEGAVKSLWNVPVALLSFFWGLLTILVSLIIMINQPDTWVCLALTVVVSVVSIIALIASRRAAASAST